MARKDNTILNPKRLGLAAGIIWGTTIFGTTLLSVATGFGNKMMEVYGSIHPGYSISIVGAFVGLVYAFICATAGVYIFAWLYNWLGKKI